MVQNWTLTSHIWTMWNTHISANLNRKRDSMPQEAPPQDRQFTGNYDFENKKKKKAHAKL